MKASRNLLKQMTFICLALITTLCVIMLGSKSTAQTIRVPGAEPFPTPSPTQRVEITQENQMVTLGGTWLLPVPTNDIDLTTPVIANPDVATIPYSTRRLISVLKNDVGTGLEIVSVTEGVNGGQTSLGSNGTILYLSRRYNSKNDRFSYTIRDRSGKTSIGKVLVELEYKEN
jgi:hypothetical protein